MPTGTSTYPTTLDTFAPTRADGDWSGPDVVKHAAALGAIETELGVNPSASAATVAARILAVEGGYTNVKAAPYNATGNGTTDDTAAIVAAIAACPSGGTVYFPPGLYKLTAALDLPARITLRGAGVAEVWGDVSVSGGTQHPGAAPWLVGTVLLQTVAATNAINLPETGCVPNLIDFGIRFADAIAFNNTGHGVNGVPTATTGGGHDNGPCSGIWSNVPVFGHDGNHYAFTLVNSNFIEPSQLRGYGGGGWYEECDSFVSSYGNAIRGSMYFCVFAGGSAHGFHLKSRTASFPGNLNLLSFHRPQANLVAVEGGGTPLDTAFSIPALDSGQQMWKTEGSPAHCFVEDPNMEGAGAFADNVTFGTVDVRGGGLLNENVTYRSQPLRRGVPTIAIAAGLPATLSVQPPSSLAPLTDRTGLILYNPNGGYGPGGPLFRVTFQSLTSFALVVLFPVTGQGVDGKFWVNTSGVDGSGKGYFEVWCRAALAAATDHQIGWHAVE